MLITSLVALLAIFILNVVFGMYYKFGYKHYWFFETLHFLGGFFVAMFFSNFFQSPVMILAGVGSVIFLWEAAERLVAKIPRLAKYIKKVSGQKNIMPGRGDTVLDVFLGLAGALVFIYLFI